MSLKAFIESNLTVDLDDDKNLDPKLIRDVQYHLDRLGYPLATDGIIGTKTLAAFARFKKDNYLGEPDKLGGSSAKILLEKSTVPKGFFMPTKGIGWISSPFGRRSRGFHKGIDIAANEGVAVYAVDAGIVTAAITGCLVGSWKCGGGYGNVVYLKHNRAEFDETRYAHLARLAAGISIGDKIAKGQLIGYVGNTGHSFGNHLHFETRKNGNAFNPQSVINPIV
jgi:murein DD-endopeptidase MepM/ murein hydrolase activator NlpD